MPNWCWNTLTISHKDPAMIKRFRKAAETGILQEFLPCPEELLDTPSSPGTTDKELQERHKANIEKYGASDWYDWNVANWGTKWDFTCDSDDGNNNDNEITTAFDTAWAPPIAAYRKLEEMGFEIDAYYQESGMCFAGHYEQGEEEYVEYDFSNENWRDTMSDDIADMLESEYESWQMWQEEEKEQNESQT